MKFIAYIGVQKTILSFKTPKQDDINCRNITFRYLMKVFDKITPSA